MKIVIDIPEDSYKATCSGSMLPPDVKNVANAIKNGTPLPTGHGRLVDADAYRKEMMNSREFDFFKILDMQPTIIDAE